VAEIEWAAGFFDGEGYVGARVKNRSRQQSKACSLSLRVGQRHREPLERFQRAVGGVGQIYERQIREQPYYTYSIGSRVDVLAVIELLRPHLCSIKVKQADDTIAKLSPARKKVK
jgi:hypothetical protein